MSIIRFFCLFIYLFYDDKNEMIFDLNKLLNIRANCILIPKNDY